MAIKSQHPSNAMNQPTDQRRLDKSQRRNRELRLLAVALVFVGLSGCATYFERQAQNRCFYHDWFAKGFDAAKHGRQREQAWNKADKRCEQHNIWTNKTDFNHGYALGLDAFCQSENGFEFGLRGKSYHPICDTLSQVDFDAAYDDGLEIKRREQNLQHIFSKLNAEKKHLENINFRRRELANQTAPNDLSNNTHPRASSEQSRLDRRRRLARNNIANLRSGIRRAEEYLAELEDQLYDYHYPDGKPDAPLYSVRQSVTSDNHVVTQPAIFICKPKKINGHGARQIKADISQIATYITSNHSRDFRFQIIKEAEISFINQQAQERTISTEKECQDSPTILLWSPGDGLSTVKLTGDFETLKLTIDRFIDQNGKRNSP